MNRAVYRLLTCLAVACVCLPLAVIFIWSVADSWRFPDLLPQAWSARGIKEISNGDMMSVLLSSVGISAIVALLSTWIGTLTARAVVFYEFKLKKAVRFLNLLPLMIPSAAFAMGIHVSFIKIGISDTAVGVIIIHLICGLPYSVNIMCDMTSSVGKKLEQQASLLGAGPFRAFINVSFYALLPGMITSFCMAYIISFSQYFLTLIIGGGRVKTLSTVIVPLIASGDRTLSGAYGMVFIGSALLFFGIVQWLGKKIGMDRSVEIFR